uniref:RHS repeat-associated core domain-containing protein n=1 Tax=Rosenbergiella nectarea TaxID=988801 RepID=UPI001F4DBEC0
NQLVTVSRNNHILAEYHYDAFGRRIGKWVGGAQQWFVYSPEGLLAQLDGHGQMQQAWGWEPGTLYGSKPLWQADLSPEATLKTAKVAWLIADNTGTPLLALNDQGNTVWKGTRDPFAAVVPNAESQITVNLRYAGQYADAETGLYYNGFRYYDPLTGRYLQ